MTIIVEIADLPVKTIDTIIIDVALTIKIDDPTEITLNQDHPTEIKALIVTTIDQQAERINFAAIPAIIAAATVAIDHTIDPTVDHRIAPIIFLPAALVTTAAKVAAIIAAHHIDRTAITNMINHDLGAVPTPETNPQTLKAETDQINVSIDLSVETLALIKTDLVLIAEKSKPKCLS